MKIKTILWQAIKSGAFAGGISGALFFSLLALEGPVLIDTTYSPLLIQYNQANFLFNFGYYFTVGCSALFGGIMGLIFGFGLQKERLWKKLPDDAFLTGLIICFFLTLLSFDLHDNIYPVNKAFFFLRFLAGGFGAWMGGNHFLNAMLAKLQNKELLKIKSKSQHDPHFNF